MDALLRRLPQLPLLCVVHDVLVAWIRLLGELFRPPVSACWLLPLLTAIQPSTPSLWAESRINKHLHLPVTA